MHEMGRQAATALRREDRMAGIFKAYDIRGVYGDSLTKEIVFNIGRALATFLGCRKVAVGRDMRPHSMPVFESLAGGLMVQGCEVIDLGLCSTPMLYFGTGKLGVDAGVMITASHNPAEWNGLKLTRAEAVPISGATGIQDIEHIVWEEAFSVPPGRPGILTRHHVLQEYIDHVRTYARLERPIRIAADMANAMGALEAKALNGILQVDALYEDLDGTFPNHEANPLKHETLAALQKKVRTGGYDFGVAFDGDADRAGFVDENGDIIPMDLTTALIAQDILKREKGVILYDLRSSWAVREVIEENGGTPMMSRVGHAFIKQQMRDSKAIFAGELSGHYYFRDNFYTESSSMAVLSVALLNNPFILRRATFEIPTFAAVAPATNWQAFAILLSNNNNIASLTGDLDIASLLSSSGTHSRFELLQGIRAVDLAVVSRYHRYLKIQIQHPGAAVGIGPLHMSCTVEIDVPMAGLSIEMGY